MRSRPLLLALVVFVAALSGCSVLLDDGGSVPMGGDGSTPTNSDASVGTSTGTPTATPEPDTLRTFDAETLNDEHVAALERAGSFTAESSLVIRGNRSTQYINGSYAIERDGPAANTANITMIVDNTTRDIPTTTRYTEGETTYERQVARTDDGTDVSYRSASAPYNESGLQPVNRSVAYSLGEIAREVIDNSTWNRTGSGTLNGADVIRYDTSGERFGAGQLGPNAAGGATLAIDEDGVVRYIAYRFVTVEPGQRGSYTYEASYVGVGETDFQRPDWTDEA
jgi:hypothetical protein